MLALRSKYAVTLYEILEAYVNRRESGFTVSIEDFRSWLKVPEGAYAEWKDFKRNVILPAVNEINEHGEEGGFFVAYEGLREGKASRKSNSPVTKLAARDDRDAMLQGKQSARALLMRRGRGGAAYEPTDARWSKSACSRPNWDRPRAARAISGLEQGQGSAEKSARRFSRLGEAVHEGRLPHEGRAGVNSRHAARRFA